MADTQDDIPFFSRVAPTRFSWPVKVPVPAEGRYVYATFTGVFRYIPGDQIDEWLAPDGKGRRDSELAADVLLEVQDLKGDGGQVLESTPELVTRVLAVDRAPSAVVATFLAVMRGVAAEKN